MEETEKKMQDREKQKNSPESQFGNYLKMKIEERGISREELCRGICDYEYMILIESGEEMPDCFLQDTLRERLGVDDEDYESYLDYEDYDRWKARMQILNAIISEKWQEAERLLKLYQTGDGFQKDSNLEKQFVLSVQGQIRRNQGADVREVQEIYRKAVNLTISHVEFGALDRIALSLKELNLLLELERTERSDKSSQRYQEIMAYVEKYFDKLGRAKIYPKAVYYLSQCQPTCTERVLMQYCDRALDYLRDTSRSFYLWEILELRGKLLEGQLQRMKENPAGVWELLSSTLEQNNAWQWALLEVYEEFQVRKDTFEDCYLYMMRGVNCINDVIRVRRKMLGISQQKLCGEGNSVRALQRLENRQTRPRWSTVEIFFEKLKIPVVHIKSDLMTNNCQISSKMNLLKRCVNSLKWREADALLQEIKESVSPENVYNQQVLMQKEAKFLWNFGEISQQEYKERMRAALELTLPLKWFLEKGDKYLTNQELNCLVGLIKILGVEDELLIDFADSFEAYFESYAARNILQSVEGMYAFVMNNVASKLGDKGENDRAYKINEEMIKEYLHSRRLRILPLALYDRWWNRNEAVKRGISLSGTMESEQELNKCIQLANLDKQKRREEFYRHKLEQFGEGS